MASITSITRHNFEAEVTNSKLPVVLDVFADWCGPCQHMAPFFAELAQDHGTKYRFAKLNIDEARDVAVEFGITSVPTFLFFKAGKVVGQEVGYMSKEQLLETIQQHLD